MRPAQAAERLIQSLNQDVEELKEILRDARSLLETPAESNPIPSKRRVLEAIDKVL